MQELNIDGIKTIINIIQKEINKNKDFLNKCDGELGDGDLGITMAKAFEGISEFIDQYQGEDVGELLIKSGISANNAASSTMGTLLATALMRAGKEIKGEKKININNAVELLEAGINGIKERGNADIGEKTILDALIPALREIKDSKNEINNFQQLTNTAYLAAKEGMENTKDLVAKHGRAAYYQEKSKGKVDPGAQAAVIVFKAMNDYFS